MHKKMLPSIHLVVSLILAAILFPFFGLYSLFALVGGYLVDVDHLIFYWIKFKSLNIKQVYRYFRDIVQRKDVEEHNTVIAVFHSLELMGLLIVLSFYHIVFFVILIGLIVHVILDMIAIHQKFKVWIHLSLIKSLKNVKKHNKK